VQDFEFTVEDRRLFLLQTRRAKVSSWAAVHIAADLVDEGVITIEEADRRLAGYALDEIERVGLAPGSDLRPLAQAVPATLGVVSGRIALSEASARSMAQAGTPVILVREDLATEDFPALLVVAGVLTAHGGRTSHAAVVARDLDKVCLAGCAALAVDAHGDGCTIGGQRFAEGDAIPLDGDSGAIYAGIVPIVRSRPTEALRRLARHRAATVNRSVALAG
jgi:pyruvate,orthophosphate dikinase